MSKYVRTGMLPVYNTNVNRDWQLLGYWNNWILSLKYAPKDSLVGFATPEVEGNISAPSTMKVRRLKIYNGEAVVISQQTETSHLIAENKIRNGVTLTYYYRTQQPLDTILTRGYIYDIYIEDAEGNSFYSDIFVAIDESELTLYTESGQGLLTEDGLEILI